MTDASEQTQDAELLVDFIITLDGYGTSAGWPGWWGLEGPEYLKWLEEQPESSYTLLMGANTYRMFSDFADANDDGTAGFDKEESDSISGLAAIPKIVFSSTIEKPTMPNTTIIRDDAAAAVAELKRAGTSMSTVGSISLARSLLEAGLVDRLRVVIFPVITGSSGEDKVFDDYPDVALELLESKLLDGRLQVLSYKPTPINGPPENEHV